MTSGGWASLALLAVTAVAAVAWRWWRDPERRWARGEWERLTAIRGDGPVAIHWRSVGWLGLGRPLEAVAEVRRLETQRCSPVLYANSLVEALVTAGRYRAALEAMERTDFSGEAWLPHEPVLVKVNGAEALYNLGRWEEAWALLAPLDEAASRDALSRSALALQRSWILAGLGRSAEARKALAQIVRHDLPRSYWPEVHFARAWSTQLSGDAAGALREVALAERLATRASTRRNVHFVRGRLLADAGELAAAEAELARGAAHPFRLQGADGLLLWGEVLARLGRPTEAIAAWRLCTERDPESALAATAARRLQEAAASSPR